MVRAADFTAVRLAIALSASGGLAAGCGPMEPPLSADAADGFGLPAWDSHARDVFDDNIDPAAVGLTLEGPSPRSDRYLRERAQTADVVARVRVSTVTVDSIGDEKSYHIGIQVGHPPITPSKLADTTFDLHIRPASRAFGIARAFDARLRGLTFIGFIRRYRNAEGEPEIHWHLAPDTAEVAAAVKEAVALRELSTP